MGITPTVVKPDIDETPRRGEGQRAYVSRLSSEKGIAVLRLLAARGLVDNSTIGKHAKTGLAAGVPMADQGEDTSPQTQETAMARAVITADTAVYLGRRLMPKPASLEQARQALLALSGRQHTVYGGITVAWLGAGGAGGEGAGAPYQVRKVLHRVEVTKVQFKRLTADDIAFLVAADEWQDKAGGYAIQGRAGSVIKRINGCYDNVVGLSSYHLRQMLLSARLG